MVKIIILVLGVLTLLKYVLPEFLKILKMLRSLLREIEKLLSELIRVIRVLCHKLLIRKKRNARSKKNHKKKLRV